jgi:hypothetical protein
MLKDIAILVALIVASPAIGIMASILSAFMCVAVLAMIVRDFVKDKIA